jgi:hypothetical protein
MFILAILKLNNDGRKAFYKTYSQRIEMLMFSYNFTTSNGENTLKSPKKHYINTTSFDAVALRCCEMLFFIGETLVFGVGLLPCSVGIINAMYFFKAK